MNDDVNRWDKAATSYHQLQGRTGDIFHQQVIDPAIRGLLGPVKGTRILDAGCGNGYWTSWLDSQGATTQGIDGSPTLIGYAQEMFPTCTFQVVDLATPLPFPSASFDRVLCSMVLHCLAEPEKALQEFRRVLTAQGELILAIPHPAFAQPVGKVSVGILGRFARRAQKLFVTDYTTERSIDLTVPGLSQSTPRYHRPLGRYIELFTQSGFVIEQMLESVPKSGHASKKPGKLFWSTTIPLVAVFQLRISLDN